MKSKNYSSLHLSAEAKVQDPGFQIHPFEFGFIDTLFSSSKNKFFHLLIESNSFDGFPVNSMMSDS